MRKNIHVHCNVIYIACASDCTGCCSLSLWDSMENLKLICVATLFTLCLLLLMKRKCLNSQWINQIY